LYGNINPAKSNIIKNKISLANKKVSKNAVIKRNKTIKEKYNVENICFLKKKKKDSLYEIKLRNLLNGIKFKINNYEFDILIPNTNILIEVDGLYFHPDKIFNLDITQINSIVNDIKKEKLAKENNYQLIRIRENKNINSLKDVLTLNYLPERNFNKEIIITSKEKFEKYVLLHGKEKLLKYTKLYMNFYESFFILTDLEKQKIKFNLENLKDMKL